MLGTSCLAGSLLLLSLRGFRVLGKAALGLDKGAGLTKAHVNKASMRTKLTTGKTYSVNPIGAATVITTLIYWFVAKLTEVSIWKPDRFS